MFLHEGQLVLYTGQAGRYYALAEQSGAEPYRLVLSNGLKVDASKDEVGLCGLAPGLMSNPPACFVEALHRHSCQR